MMNPNHKEQAITMARSLLERRPLFLDTETTGFSALDQVIEVAVLERTGELRFDVRIRPTVEISEGASDVHGLIAEMLVECPTFGDVWPRLAAVLRNRVLVTYNADFDMRLLAQSVEAVDTKSMAMQDMRRHANCAMRLYARYWGERSRGRGAYRWQKLTDACAQQGIVVPVDYHAAIVDAEATRRLMFKIAEMEDPK